MSDHPPLHDITFPDSDHIVNAVFRDSSTILVHLWPAALNLWAVAVHYWPQTLGTLTALAAAVVLYKSISISRDPRRKGELYCRKCGYHLTGQPTCPECGVDTAKKKPVRARPALIRLIPALCILVPPLTLLLAAWIGGVERDGQVARRWVWDWPWLSARMNEKRWGRLNPFYVYIDRVAAVDVNTGKTIRTICQSGASTEFHIRISPDGTRLVTVDSDGTTWYANGPLVLRDAKSGSVIARLPVPAKCRGTGSYWTHVAGFGDRGQVYCVLSNWTTWHSELIEWTPTSGQARTLVEEPVSVRSVANGTSVAESRFYEYVHAGNARFVSWSNFDEYYAQQGTVIRAFAADGKPLWEHRMGQRFCNGNLACSSSQMAFMSCMHEGVAGIDLATGEPTGLLAAPAPDDGGWQNTGVSPDGRLLFQTTVTSKHIVVRDTEAKQWLDPLDNAAQVMDPQLAVSPDSHWLAAQGALYSGGSGKMSFSKRHLFIYDLSDFNKRSAP